MFTRTLPLLVAGLVVLGAISPAEASHANNRHAHKRPVHAKQIAHPKRPDHHRQRRTVTRVAAPIVRVSPAPTYAPPAPTYVQPAPTYVAQPVPAIPAGWLITVNAKGIVSPNYLGSNRYSGIGYPTLSFRRPGEPVIWSSPDDAISYSLYQNGYFAIGPAVNYRAGRSSGSVSPALNGLHETRWTLEGGLFADVWLLPDTIRVHGELLHGFRSENGFVGSLGADWVSHWNQFTFGIGPRLKFGNDHFMNEYFGVNTWDAAINPNLTPFNAKGGLYAVGAYGSATYRQSDTWSYTLHGGYDRLTRDAAKSPIVTTTNAKDQYSVGAIVSYTFSYNGWSPF